MRQPLGDTGYCKVTSVGALSVISSWANLAFDTCVFLAIFIQLTSHASPNTNNTISFLCGYGLPDMTRHIHQDGVLYYLYGQSLIRD